MTTQPKSRIVSRSVWLGMVGLVVAGYGYVWFAAKQETEALLLEVQQNKEQANASFDYRIDGFPFHFNVTIQNLNLTSVPTAETVSPTSVSFQGDLLAEIGVFGRSTRITLPKAMQIQQDGQSLKSSFNEPAVLTVGYNEGNYNLFAYVMKWKTFDIKEFMKKLNRVSYRDAGGRFGSLDDQHYSETAATTLDATFGIHSDRVTAEVQAGVKDYVVTDGYYRWQQAEFRDDDLPDGLVKELALFVMDFRLHEGPITMETDFGLSIPSAKPYPSTNPFHVAIRKLMIRDGLGESNHVGALTGHDDDKGKPIFYGDYSLTVTNYEAAFDRYLALLSGSVKLAYEHKDELQELAKTKGAAADSLPDPQFVDEMVALLKTQFTGFFGAIGAVKDGTLTLKLSKAKDAPQPSLNGKTMQEVAPIMMQYAMPVLLKSEELKTKGKTAEGMPHELAPQPPVDALPAETPPAQ